VTFADARERYFEESELQVPWLMKPDTRERLESR
jgi:hypothetical protein